MNTNFFYPIPNAGFLSISGSSRVDFLQRQTSNDLRNLGADDARLTVLTSPTARILDVFRVFEDGESLGIVSLPERVLATEAYLRSRIFFNDDVRLENQSAKYAQILLIGSQAAQVLDTLGLDSPPTVGGVARFTFRKSAAFTFGEAGFDDIVFRLILPQSETESIMQLLAKQGTAELSFTDYEVIRIEAGLPGHQTELTDDYTPLEVGLQHTAISMTKGCFTGQEIIARQVNYDKITRRLMGLRLDASVELATTVRIDGKSVGKITSVAASPRFGDIALAVLKRPFDQPQTPVDVGGVPAVVAELPFVS
ncbi:MAG: folate-binding protein YgfZ [Anaerolineales bacterium]|nr:folate-binding protein YgfZ [Anaerolineales bacterium]